jgi:hypothetical protein
VRTVVPYAGMPGRASSLKASDTTCKLPTELPHGEHGMEVYAAHGMILLTNSVFPLADLSCKTPISPCVVLLISVITTIA